MRSFFAILVALVFATQTRKSQHGTVTQRVGATEIAITYSRPVARGRTLFGEGGVVPWSRMWHPGADSATTITFSKNVTIEGQRLAAGRYTLWAIPEQAPAPWTMIFSRGVDIWHTSYAGESQDALRINVSADSASHIETLTYFFPMVDADSAVLRLQWGKTAVEMRIREHR
jgi:hypothetical protein